MQTPVFAEIFACQECGKAVTSHRRWCSGVCKLRAWLRAHPDRKYTKARVCPTCQHTFTSTGNLYCSDTCKAQAKKPKQVVTRPCVVCAKAFTVRFKTSKQQTCSPSCRATLLSSVLRGKKYRPYPPRAVHPRVCARCRKSFLAYRELTLCSSCVRAVSPNRDHGKPERRAKKAGVPYIYGIKPEQVFARDRWCCQLCGCKTPQRLRGKNQLRSPEVDHIVPISQGGGHTWDNVQCACRKCNQLKRANIRGQLRLAI
jgi:5-methylcytosine-specific restriction endonuclease McrA